MHIVEIVRSEAGDGADLGINDAQAAGGHRIQDRPVVEAPIECLSFAVEVASVEVSAGVILRRREMQEPPIRNQNEDSDVI